MSHPTTLCSTSLLTGVLWWLLVPTLFNSESLDSPSVDRHYLPQQSSCITSTPETASRLQHPHTPAITATGRTTFFMIRGAMATERRLRVKVERCTSVPDQDSGGLFGSSTSDPKMKVCLSGSSTSCKTTSKKENERNPTWNAVYDFLATNPMSRTFSFTLYDDDSGGFPPSGDDVIGSWSWPVSSLGLTEKDEWVQKQRIQGWRCYVSFRAMDFLTLEPTVSEVGSSSRTLSLPVGAGPGEDETSTNSESWPTKTSTRDISVSLEPPSLETPTQTTSSPAALTRSSFQQQSLSSWKESSDSQPTSSSTIAASSLRSSRTRRTESIISVSQKESSLSPSSTAAPHVSLATTVTGTGSRRTTTDHIDLSPPTTSITTSKVTTISQPHMTDICDEGRLLSKDMVDSLAFFSEISDPELIFSPTEQASQILAGRRSLKTTSSPLTTQFLKAMAGGSNPLPLDVKFSAIGLESLMLLLKSGDGEGAERVPLLLRELAEESSDRSPVVTEASTKSGIEVVDDDIINAPGHILLANSSTTRHHGEAQNSSGIKLDLRSSSSSAAPQFWLGNEPWKRTLEVIVPRHAFHCSEKLFPPSRFEIGPNFTLALHPKRELPLSKALGIVARPAIAFAAASSLMGSASNSLYQTRVSALTALASCEFEHGTSLGAFISPTDLKFGPAHGQYYRGAIIGNLLVFLAFNAFFFLLALVVTLNTRRRRQRELANEAGKRSEGEGATSTSFPSDFSNSLAAIHFPSVLIVPTALGLQGTASSSVSIFVHSQSFDDVLLAFFGVSACLSICLGCTAPVLTKYFPLELRLRDGVKEGSIRSKRSNSQQRKQTLNNKNLSIRRSVEEEGLVESEGDPNGRLEEEGETTSSSEKTMDQLYDFFMMSDYHWIDPRPQQHNNRWKRRFLFLFYDYKYCWFLPLEIWLSFLLGIIEGIRISDKSVCVGQALLTFLSFAGVALLAAGLYPSFTRFQQGFILVIYILSAIGGICLVYALMHEGDSLSGSASRGVEVAAFGVAVVGMIKFLIDLWFAFIWLKSLKDPQVVVRSQIQKTFLPNIDAVCEDDELNQAAEKEQLPSLVVATTAEAPNDDEGADCPLLSKEEEKGISNILDSPPATAAKNHWSGFDSYDPPSLDTSFRVEEVPSSLLCPSNPDEKQKTPAKTVDGQALWGSYEYVEEEETQEKRGKKSIAGDPSATTSSSLLLMDEMDEGVDYCLNLTTTSRSSVTLDPLRSGLEDNLLGDRGHRSTYRSSPHRQQPLAALHVEPTFPSVSGERSTKRSQGLSTLVRSISFEELL